MLEGARNHGALSAALTHRLQAGADRGRQVGELLSTDSGLVELERMAGDEACGFDDREAAALVVCDPVSVERLLRLRTADYVRMDQAILREGAANGR